jgi:hypothetical protein
MKEIRREADGFTIYDEYGNKLSKYGEHEEMEICLRDFTTDEIGKALTLYNDLLDIDKKEVVVIKKEETFEYHISSLNRMLEETKKDIDVISKKVINDSDKLEVGKMIDAWEKTCQAVKKMDEEIYMLGSIMNDFPNEE